MVWKFENSIIRSMDDYRKKMTVDCLYVNGDSWAYGSGLVEGNRLEKCWAGCLAKDLGLELILNAERGGSNHRILRTTVQDLQQLINEGKRPLVILGWTFPHRYELCRSDNNCWDKFSGTGHDADPELAKLITTRYNSDIGNLELFGTQVMLIQSFLRNLKLPYLLVPTFRIEFEALPPDMLANIIQGIDFKYCLHDFSLRSYLNSFNDIDWIDNHPGPEGHRIIADFLLTQVNRRKLCIQ